MKTTLLNGFRAVLGEITVGIAECDARAIAIERIDKHMYECRIGEDRFVFRSVRSHPHTPSRGPGIELRYTHRSDGAAPADLEELPGRPGLVRSVRFARPVDLHIERMDERWYWCSIGDHEFSMKRLGRDRAGIELVRA